MTDPIEVAWIAGFFDGEGCVTLGHHKRSGNSFGWFQLKLSVTNTYLPALERVKLTFGGSIHTRRKIVEGRRQCHQWYLSDLAAEKFLREVLPHLTVKQRQAELALSYRALPSKVPYKKVTEEHYDEASRIAAAIRECNGRNPRKDSAVVVPRDYVVAV